MMLRPRYSLHTLLVVTALVAGGVKLCHPFEFPLADVRFEYDYLRTWQDQRILSVTCVPTSAAYFLVGSSEPIPYDPPGIKGLYSDSSYREDLKKGVITKADPKERVVCWIRAGRKPDYREVPLVPSPQLSKRPGQIRLRREIVSGEELLKSYLVTDLGKIYEFGGAYIAFWGIETTLDQVVDLDVRARIAEELNKIPSPR
jgi:hypothetical protein